MSHRGRFFSQGISPNDERVVCTLPPARLDCLVASWDSTLVDLPCGSANGAADFCIGIDQVLRGQEVCDAARDALAGARDGGNGQGGGGIGDASVQAGSGQGGGGSGDASLLAGIGQGGGCKLEVVDENFRENFGGCYAGDNNKIELCLDELIVVDNPDWECVCIDDETAKFE